MATSLQKEPVLVTGATGLIGANLIQRLLNEGATVRATLHRKGPVIYDPRVEYVRADLTSAQDCRRAVAGQRFIFMAAANSSGAAAISATPMVHVTSNVIMNALMLEAAYDAGVEKFLWLSSTTSYPDAGPRPLREEEMFDGDPYDKYFFVGWMKRFTEVLCQMYGERLSRTMTTIVLRPTNVYGPYDDFQFETSHVAPALIRKVAEGWNPLEVWGTGDDVRDLLYVDDMVEAMLLALRHINGHAAFNIGLGKGYSVKQLLGFLLQLAGYQPEIVFAPEKPTMIPIRLVDTTKARDALRFTAQVDLPEGLERTLRWYRDHGA